MTYCCGHIPEKPKFSYLLTEYWTQVLLVDWSALFYFIMVLVILLLLLSSSLCNLEIKPVVSPYYLKHLDGMLYKIRECL